MSTTSDLQFRAKYTFKLTSCLLIRLEAHKQDDLTDDLTCARVHKHTQIEMQWDLDKQNHSDLCQFLWSEQLKVFKEDFLCLSCFRGVCIELLKRCSTEDF